MAKAKFVLVAIFILATGQAHARYTEQATAAAILRVAAENVPPVLQVAFRQMATIVDTATVRIAPRGTEFTRCTPNTLAYTVPAISREIYLCQTIIVQSHTAIAQTLIHEAAHLAGYMNECDATILEVAAMKQSTVGLAYRNGYMSRCGL